jgi:LysM repeat protein
MNDKLTNDPNTGNEKISRRLINTAEQVHANPIFLDELEQRLRDMHKPRRTWLALPFRKLTPAIGWIGLLLLLGFVLNWSIRSLVPVAPSTDTNPLGGVTAAPSAASEPTFATPVPEDAGYDWRGTKLFLAASLPASPATANVYLWKLSQPVTAEEARALAQRFGIDGEPAETPGELPGYFDYTVTDGVRSVRLRSDHYFTYHSTAGEPYLDNLTEEQARSVADAFLKQHSFDFEYKFERALEMQGQNFYILPLVSGGYEIRFDHLMPTGYEITMDNTGENIIFSGYWMDYEALGEFEIISAEEAFAKLLDPNPQTGMMEIFRGQGGGGGGGSFLQLNLSGTPVPFPSPTATPQVNMEVGDYTVKEGDTLGSISQEFGVSVAELIEVNQLSELGLIQIGQKLIIPGQPGQEAEDSSGGQKMEDVHGHLSITIYQRPDGSQRKEYRLTGSLPNGAWFFYILEGPQLHQLEPYNALPINISGNMRIVNDMPTIFVEAYTIPYPDLQFQIVRGAQSRQEINGQPGVVVFTTEDGRSFVEVMASTNIPTHETLGRPGDLIEQEVLIVPGETIGNLPVMHVYQGGIVTDNSDRMQIQANQIQVIEEAPDVTESLAPTATLETVDLVFYVRYPPYALLDVRAGTQYLQPAWRFHGHYSNGDEFEILVQALRQEFLLPELAPYTPPG